ncbi:hypothetical protein [Mesorhizobium sp. J428]|uniref:hypothetical protein n=1 Tax=Mesorhizobium sp. J428 TaxID=2898440 RepID=UPI002151B9B3|nr:hypothetical protein [Mesorhizobium sp. J428]MCR5859456.1 hypothetical protein [Mesorhizobium sp. J428]
MRQILSYVFLAVSLSGAHADEASYRAGYQTGYSDGYRDAAGTVMNRARPFGTSGTVIWKPFVPDTAQPGSILLPGQNFSATIDPAQRDSAFTFNPDSSVAIIPRPAMDEIKQKMGSEFVQENMILNNPAAE